MFGSLQTILDKSAYLDRKRCLTCMLNYKIIMREFQDQSRLFRCLQKSQYLQSASKIFQKCNNIIKY